MRGFDRIPLMVHESFAAYLQATSECERAKIARELHDDVGGVLAASKLELDIIVRQLPDGMDEIRNRLRHLISALDTGLAVERRLVERLRPSVLDHLGLYAAMQWLANDQCRRAGISCAFVVKASEPDHVSDAAIVVLRTLEDAVAFALNQSGTTAIEIEVRNMDESMEVLIVGRGTQPSERAEPSATGLRSWAASERARILGGSCVTWAGSVDGSSTLLRIPVANLMQTSTWSAGEIEPR